MPTSTQSESTHPAESSLVAQNAVCSYLRHELELRLEQRAADQARSVLLQGLLEQVTADLGFSGPVSFKEVKQTLTPIMHAFGTEFTLRVIDERPVLITYVIRNDLPVPVQIRTVNDLGKLLSVQKRCAVPADNGDVHEDLRNVLLRLVSVTQLSGVLHAVAWATEETSGCTLVSMNEEGLSALKQVLQRWMSEKQERSPEEVLDEVAYRQAI